MQGLVSQAKDLRPNLVGTGDSGLTSPTRQGPWASACHAPKLSTNATRFRIGKVGLPLQWRDPPSCHSPKHASLRNHIGGGSNRPLSPK